MTLPRLYALAPALVLLAVRAIDTALITNGSKPNPYLEKVQWKKTSAQMLDVDGEFSGGQEKVAVLLLGAKSNHPLGVFSPDYLTVANYLKDMSMELEGGPQDDTGFLGQTGFTGRDERGAVHNLMISYWRSIDDVHKYAHGPLHIKAWKWWDKSLKAHQHIGFMHEVFEAPRGMWEAVYINFQPTMMGATTFLKRDGKLEGGVVSDEWVSGLMDANRGKLRTSVGRRGQTHKEADTDKFGKNYYVDN